MYCLCRFFLILTQVLLFSQPVSVEANPYTNTLQVFQVPLHNADQQLSTH